MVNNRNKDKEIPLCLLEPKEKKKRRHPIHKNKNLGELINFVGTSQDYFFITLLLRS